jgi:hypothetical protein
LLTERVDQTLVFTHLSFQEYLAAWHLNATIEGDDQRRQMAERFGARENWWETFRLWAGVTEGINPVRIEPVLASLAQDTARGIWLAGCILADGIGSNAAFIYWATLLPDAFANQWPSGADVCAQAWATSRQKERAEQLGIKLDAAARELSGIQAIRLRDWARTAALPGTAGVQAPGTPRASIADRLSSKQVRLLSTALQDAFDQGSFRQLLRYQLDVSLEQVATGGSFANTVLQVIQWAEARGLVDVLIRAARATNPENKTLAVAAERIGSDQA